MQIWVYVRHNGTDVNFYGCKKVKKEECTIIEPYTVRTYNCSIHKECEFLQGMYNCTEGMCKFIDPFFECAQEGPPKNPNNCKLRDRCSKLTGTYHCSSGACRQLKPKSKKLDGKRLKYPRCERKCKEVNTKSKNVVLFTSNGYYMGHCDSADEEVSRNWTSISETFIASCSKVQILKTPSGNTIKGKDCIDGISIDSSTLAPLRLNYSELINYFKNQTIEGTGRKILQYEDEVILTNRTKLLVNLEGCVNTLSDECHSMFLAHGNDGSNYTAQSIFPCFINEDTVSDFALLSFNRDAIVLETIIFASVPSGLLVISCLLLVLCSKIVQVDGSHMYIDCCPGKENTNQGKYIL